MKAKEITPKKARCALGACSSIFKTDRGTFVIVGKVLAGKETPNNVLRRLGAGEIAVEIPQNILPK